MSVHFDGWFREMFSNKLLGANISDDGKRTSFAVFAPRILGLKLYLYTSPNNVQAESIIEMEVDENGVWSVEIEKNLEGKYYDFTVHSTTEPGSHSFEVDGGHISDPYARANVEAQGKSRVMRKTDPATPLQNGIPKLGRCDCI